MFESLCHETDLKSWFTRVPKLKTDLEGLIRRVLNIRAEETCVEEGFEEEEEEKEESYEDDRSRIFLLRTKVLSRKEDDVKRALELEIMRKEKDERTLEMEKLRMHEEKTLLKSIEKMKNSSTERE